jgi:hypothetical protein
MRSITGNSLNKFSTALAEGIVITVGLGQASMIVDGSGSVGGIP